MSYNNGNQPPLQLPALTPTIHNDCNDHSQITQYFNFCLEASTFDGLCVQLEKIPLPLRIRLYEALYIHFQSLESDPFLRNTKADIFSDVSLLGIFFSTFKASSTIVSNYVQNILQQSDSDKFKQHFYLIPLNLRAEVHEALFHKALWSHLQMEFLYSLNIFTDLYGADIQLTEPDLQTSHFQNSLFDALDEFSFTQFRKIPLQYRSSVHKVLLRALQHNQQSAEFYGWVSTIQAADLYLDFDDIAKEISEETHIYSNASFYVTSKKKYDPGFLHFPLAIGGQVCQAICFKALMLPDYPCHAISQRGRGVSYLAYYPGSIDSLDDLLNAPSFDAFITQFLSNDRSQRIRVHNDLYFYTKSDLVKYKEQFGWVLQCTHPYYFLDGFGDDLESESNQAVKCAHDFLVNPGHRDAIFSEFSQLTDHSSRFKFCLTLGSKSSYEWMSSHLDLQQYIDPLYPELVSATEEVKECVGRCLLASNLGEFKVAFHSIPSLMRHEVYTSLSVYKDFYHKKQQDFLHSLYPLEVSINVNHYISADQLDIYAIKCCSAQNSYEFGSFLCSVPYPIRARIFKLTLEQAKFNFNTDSTLNYSLSLWEISPNINMFLLSQVDECLSSDNFDQFKSRFLSIPREWRREAYEALYVKTQNDQCKFIWLLRCTHSSYFLVGFNDCDADHGDNNGEGQL